MRKRDIIGKRYGCSVKLIPENGETLFFQTRISAARFLIESLSLDAPERALSKLLAKLMKSDNNELLWGYKILPQDEGDIL